MALADSFYRIKIDMNYTTTTTANNAVTAINNVLISVDRPERAVRTNLNVYLQIVGLTESEATSLRTSLLTAWSSQARSGGKVSVVRSNDLT